MNRRARLLDSRGNPLDSRAGRPVRGRYDAAQTDANNSRHWAEADNLSARSANSPAVRRTLRNRSRYEDANNSWFAGIADSLADYLIGDGPKLQLLIDDADDLNREAEQSFADWCQAVCLADKLWLMRRARAVDGESFLFFDSDPALGDVTLDLQLFEADQVATPYGNPLDRFAVDGVEFDRLMKPRWYHLLYEHPGDGLQFYYGNQFDRVPAKSVIHWFRARRPQQYRGIPEFTPALEIFAQLRRYSMAVLAAAETAADFAAVLESQLPPDDATVEGEPWETLEIEKRMLTTLPNGYRLNQLRAEQPTTEHAGFVRVKLTEIARCLNVPYAIAAGDYSSYNYSSGRLEVQNFGRRLMVERANLERVALDRIFLAWLDEAYRAGVVPEGPDREGGWPRRWLWPGMEHVDPLKEAKGQQLRMQSYLTSFSEECQKDGIDPEARIKMIARDVENFAEYGLPNPYVPAGKSAPGESTPPDGGDNADTIDPSDLQDLLDERATAAHAGRNGFHRP